METLDKPTLKALTTSTRQEIIKLLAKRPYTASELSKILSRHVTTVSEHLAVLEKSSLVQRKEGSKWVYYSLTQKGGNLFKPSYSWSVVLSLSLISLFAGAYFYSLSGATYIAKQAESAVPQAAVRDAAQAAAINTNLLLGIILIALAAVGFIYVVRRLRARTLTKRSLYIE